MSFLIGWICQKPGLEVSISIPLTVLFGSLSLTKKMTDTDKTHMTLLRVSALSGILTLRRMQSVLASASSILSMVLLLFVFWAVGWDNHISYDDYVRGICKHNPTRTLSCLRSSEGERLGSGYPPLCSNFGRSSYSLRISHLYHPVGFRAIIVLGACTNSTCCALYAPH